MKRIYRYTDTRIKIYSDSSNIYYIVDLDKRIVECHMINASVYDEIPMYMRKYIEPFIKEVKSYVRPHYKGIAKCSPDDFFDMERGMDIARKRCLQKYYADYTRFMTDLYFAIRTKMLDGIQKVRNHAFNRLMTLDNTK